MNISYCLILLTALCGFGKQISAEGSKDSERKSMADYEFYSASEEDIDESFPGCGLQSPQIRRSDRHSSPENKGCNKRSCRRLALNNRSKRSIYIGKTSKSQGLPFFTKEKRAVNLLVAGGKNAKPHSWPWMAYLEEKSSSFIFCGASLISEKYLLTAAHCFNDSSLESIHPSKFNVVVGAHLINQGRAYPIKKIFMHPDYNGAMHYNDICIIEVRHPIKLSKKVYPICLPSDKLRDKIYRDNYNVTVAGWGDTSRYGKASNVLQEARMPVVPLRECKAAYPADREIPRGITKSFICAGYKEGGKDACQGDSGGPLFANFEGNSYVQVGVVSFGAGCADSGYPGVYTRVSEYTKWIFDNTDLRKV